MTVFGDGTVVRIGTPQPNVVPASTPTGPNIRVGFVPGVGPAAFASLVERVAELEGRGKVTVIDLDGQPVTDKMVRLIVDTDTNQLDDITIEDI